MGFFRNLFGMSSKADSANCNSEKSLISLEDHVSASQPAPSTDIQMETLDATETAGDSKSTAHLLLFSASWCGPSKRFLSEINTGGISCYTYIDVDEDCYQDLVMKYQIRSIPTTILIDSKGNVIKKWIGYDDDDPGQSNFISFISNCGYNITSFKNMEAGDLSVGTAPRQETRAEQLAKQAVLTGHSSFALDALEAIVEDPQSINQIQDTATMALALGKMMEGDHFRENKEIIRAVGLTFYFICKAIKEGRSDSPYLYVYKMSTEYEYNKAMYHLMAHAKGEEYKYDPFDIISHVSLMSYDHDLEGMMMSDMFTEPRIALLDMNMKRIFDETYNKYHGSDPEKVKSLGEKYTDSIYSYLCNKVDSSDLDF